MLEIEKFLRETNLYPKDGGDSAFHDNRTSEELLITCRFRQFLRTFVESGFVEARERIVKEDSGTSNTGEGQVLYELLGGS